MTPVERIKAMLRDEESSGSTSRDGTPYSHVSAMEEITEQNANYLVASFLPRDAAEVTQFPEQANFTTDYHDKLSKNITIGFYELLPYCGKVSKELFDQCSNIYENNQLHFLEGYDKGIYTDEELKKYVSLLEEWYICIIEPEGEDDWYEREIISKYVNGRTDSCLEELRKFISIRPEVMSYLRYLHRQNGYAL